MTRLADRVADHMRAQGERFICWGDGLLNDAVVTHTPTKFPLARMAVALAALERAPDLFRKSYIRSPDSRGRSRRVRLFELIDP